LPVTATAPAMNGASGAIGARGIEHRANLQRAFVGSAEDIDMDLHELLPQPDRLFLRCCLEDGEAADEFSANGPSVTVIFPPETGTRPPLELGDRPPD
jgi:hypothetical protein